MKIGVYTNTDKDIGGKIAGRVASLLSNLDLLDAIYSDSHDRRIDGLDLQCDILIAIGGDGTMLKAVSYCTKKDIPILGINIGKVGFLTEVDVSEVDSAVQALVNKSYSIEERTMLICKDDTCEYNALNEVVLACNSCHVAEIEVKIDGTVSDIIRADGVLTCTPTGSTAYSLSCNGPVLSPAVNAFVINAICPHSLHSCPIVVGSDSVIEMSCSESDMKLIVDGKIAKYPEGRYSIKISKSPVSAKFIRLYKQNFYNRLLQKLSNWSV